MIDIVKPPDPMMSYTTLDGPNQGKVTNVKLRVPDDVSQKFYAFVGLAISRWADIDRCLFQCFHAALGSNEQGAAIVYYPWQGLNQRITLTNELVQSNCHKDIKAEFDKFISDMNQELPLRNFLAHQPVVWSSTITNKSHIDPDNPVDIKHFIEVQIEEKELLRGKRKPRKLDIKDIQDYCQKIISIHYHFSQFTTRLVLSYEELRKQAQPPAGPDKAPPASPTRQDQEGHPSQR